MREIKIGEKSIGGDNPTYVIAEAGCNHDCILERGKQLIEKAAEGGADAIKFQTFTSSKLVTKTVPRFWEKNAEGTTQSSLYETQDDLSKDEWKELVSYCKEKNIVFLSTPFDEESVDFLEELEVPAYKIASTDLTNIPFLRYIAKKNKPIILSVGMGNIGEVEEAVNAIKNEGNNDVIILHCMVIYPTPADQANVKFMQTLQKVFPEQPVGLSDHTLGIHIPIAASVLGAKLIEKHFTIDKNIKGAPDHPISVDPIELKEMTDGIKEVRLSLGSEVRKITGEEIYAMQSGRRRIVANIDIPMGTKIEDYMVGRKRSLEGLHPRYLDVIVGREAKRDIKEDEGITWDKV
ncbi:N-acetylneuraminate synthase [archaeon]|nr:N-acetylneuraminate synthase [archaeon]|tara:strand:+ start:1394 stop:2440 length:1047 start_codon:yes stop_codon:yes gene_type:complete